MNVFDSRERCSGAMQCNGSVLDRRSQNDVVVAMFRDWIRACEVPLCLFGDGRFGKTSDGSFKVYLGIGATKEAFKDLSA